MIYNFNKNDWKRKVVNGLSQHCKALYTRPRNSTESIKKLGGRAFLKRKPVVCMFFIEETVEEVGEETQFPLHVPCRAGFSTRNLSVCMLRNPCMLRIKYETGVKVALVMEITHLSLCNRLKSANRLLTNFYLTRSNVRLAKAAPRVVPVESNFPCRYMCCTSP